MQKLSLYKIKKKTIYKVIIIHIILIFIFCIQLKKTVLHTKKLNINNIIVKTPKPIVKAPVKKEIKQPPKKINKPISKTLPKKKTTTPAINKKILNDLEKSIAKLDNISAIQSKQKDLFIPEKVYQKQDCKKESQDTKYKQRLIEELQQCLKLPEYGPVKVSITINLNGKISDLAILDFKSEKNKNYLKNILPELTFTWFSSIFENNQTFVITFKND